MREGLSLCMCMCMCHPPLDDGRDDHRHDGHPPEGGEEGDRGELSSSLLASKRGEAERLTESPNCCLN